MSDAEEGTTVAVTSKGQATIPKAYREKLSIETPGRVRFIETEAGDSTTASTALYAKPGWNGSPCVCSNPSSETKAVIPLLHTWRSAPISYFKPWKPLCPV